MLDLDVNVMLGSVRLLSGDDVDAWRDVTAHLFTALSRDECLQSPDKVFVFVLPIKAIGNIPNSQPLTLWRLSRTAKTGSKTQG